MSEELIDNFLKGVVVKRKPLSEQEEAGAMSVASDILLMAENKLEGKEAGVFENIAANSKQKFTIVSGEAIDIMLGPENPETNLAISVSEHSGIKGGYGKTGLMKIYYFSPNEVTVKKIVLDMTTGTKAQRDSPDKYRDKKYEQQIVEVYHPDKVDLSQLLSDLSSARPLNH